MGVVVILVNKGELIIIIILVNRGRVSYNNNNNRIGVEHWEV